MDVQETCCAPCTGGGRCTWPYIWQCTWHCTARKGGAQCSISTILAIGRGLAIGARRYRLADFLKKARYYSLCFIALAALCFTKTTH